MKYKAIVFDLDGTAIPNKKDGMPSQHLIDLILKLKGKIFMCAVTGRQLFDCKHILNSLRLTSPCIIFGGTQIIDPVTTEVLWEKLIPPGTVKKILNVAKPFKYKIFISNETLSSLAMEKVVNKPEHIVYIMAANKADSTALMERLSRISGIAAYTVPAHEEGFFDIHITHQEGTKKHALGTLLQILNVEKENVIGFGDGKNDLPIFEAVGTKVAMGNGSEELKEVADLIAPSAEEDGVARVLEKLVA